ncbi:MAG: hypothetical protein ABFC80_02695 [Coriobacteriales bacterium]|nr:hypothetical protein [Actinomycetes bacterium]
MAVVVLLSAGLMAGCDADSKENGKGAHVRESVGNGSGLGSYEDAQREYEQERSRLELPTGMIFPEWRELYTDEAGSYERGTGVMEAQMYWMNAWIVEWLEQRGRDPKREQRALAVLRDEVPRSQLMTKYGDQGMRDYFAGCLQRAELGDPSGYQQAITVNEITIKREGDQ